jgi:hypothetical protein
MEIFKGKIPNLKHQIPNKSQISKYNDRNIRHSRVSTPCVDGIFGNEAIAATVVGKSFWNFEFWSLEFI